jgi:hypothetical protein
MAEASDAMAIRSSLHRWKVLHCRDTMRDSSGPDRIDTDNVSGIECLLLLLLLLLITEGSSCSVTSILSPTEDPLTRIGMRISYFLYASCTLLLLLLLIQFLTHRHQLTQSDTEESVEWASLSLILNCSWLSLWSNCHFTHLPIHSTKYWHRVNVWKEAGDAGSTSLLVTLSENAIFASAFYREILFLRNSNSSHSLSHSAVHFCFFKHHNFITIHAVTQIFFGDSQN